MLRKHSLGLSFESLQFGYGVSLDYRYRINKFNLRFALSGSRAKNYSSNSEIVEIMDTLVRFRNQSFGGNSWSTRIGFEHEFRVRRFSWALGADAMFSYFAMERSYGAHFRDEQNHYVMMEELIIGSKTTHAITYGVIASLAAEYRIPLGNPENEPHPVLALRAELNGGLGYGHVVGETIHRDDENFYTLPEEIDLFPIMGFKIGVAFQFGRL